MSVDSTRIDDVQADDYDAEVVETHDLDVDADGFEADDELEGYEDEEQDDVPTWRALRRQHVAGSVLLARLAKGGLWLLVIAAVLMATAAFLAAASQSEEPETARADDEGDVAGGDAVLAAGFAQMAVRRYLGEAGEDTEDVMTALLDDDAPDLHGVTPAGFYVLDAVTIDVDERDDGYWSATVAADLMAAVDQNYQPIGVRYYNVGVITDGEAGPVLADLPSQVAPPPNVESPGLLAGPLATPDSDSAQIAAVREFLGALLLGEGSIQRYTAPGTEIGAITPAPFVTLEIDSAAVADPEAEQTLVRASVLAVDEHDLAQRLHYTVDLRLRDGRWEVVELFDAPPLAEEETSPTEPANNPMNPEEEQS